jgi:hypothetical protein
MDQRGAAERTIAQGLLTVSHMPCTAPERSCVRLGRAESLTSARMGDRNASHAVPQEALACI